MMFAGRKGDIELLKALVQKNVPLHSRDEESGNSCFMDAYHAKQYEFIETSLRYF
jgi:hypothetical protein